MGVYDLGPRARRAPEWRRRKCAAYIRPGIDGNQHPVHSWTHPEHRESKNENPGTSTAIVLRSSILFVLVSRRCGERPAGRLVREASCNEEARVDNGISEK